MFFFFSFLIIPPPPRSTLFPYTTLFRSLKVTPYFATKIINEYIYAYSTGIIDSATPININKIRSVIQEQIAVEKELIEAYESIDTKQRELIRNFINVIG